ncbi:uroporphyrinogen-III synthase [Novosphingobium aquimarinum]|uniref:uroporphyrinogen-III synthase n=1 Tax=Novosphingobium aquimarinum TaxID=2682494 RepID=UPI001E617213|nr:uroporphyrinogen-III synthase [Novosphingobium aquimarinum]
MKPLVVIRPQPGAEATATAARALGLDVHVHSLFAVRPLPWEPPPREQFDALLIGSANGMRHAGAGLAAYRGMPAYAVGDKTADAARDAGLDVVASGSGGLQEVLDAVAPEHRRLLRIAGREHVDLIVPEGVTLIAREVYASEPKPMPRELAELLARPAVVALHSGEAAAHFAQLCDEAGIDRSLHGLAAIGPRVAQRAGEGWAVVSVAETTSDAALLALAGEMCQEPGLKPNAARESMNAEYPPIETRSSVTAYDPPQRRRPRGGMLMLTLLAFLFGAALFGWLEWQGYLDNLLPSNAPATEQSEPSPQVTPDAQADGSASSPEAQVARLASIGGMEARLAMLEDRLSRLDFQANAASGNAARAEGLLIAFAARRMIDRGEPLTFVADQLRIRFANAQPRAVETIINFAAEPVTIDELSARLDALSPELIDQQDEGTLWDRLRSDFGGLFKLRRDSSTVLGPKARIERARLMLTARRIPEAIDEVERLPGASSAEKWIVDARRYEAAQRALDLIETTAMLEPRRLQDAEGHSVEQDSPLAQPAPIPDAAAQTGGTVAPQPGA